MAKKLIFLVILVIIFSCSKESDNKVPKKCIFLDEDEGWLARYRGTDRVVFGTTNSGLIEFFRITNIACQSCYLTNYETGESIIGERYVQWVYSDLFDFFIGTEIYCMIDYIKFEVIIHMPGSDGLRKDIYIDTKLNNNKLSYRLETSYNSTLEKHIICDSCWTELGEMTINNKTYERVIRIINPFEDYGDTFAITSFLYDQSYGVVSFNQKNGQVWIIDNY